MRDSRVAGRGSRVVGEPGDKQDNGERNGGLKRTDPAAPRRGLPPHLRHHPAGKRREHAVDQHHERAHEIHAAHARRREEIGYGHERRAEIVPREAREKPSAQPFGAGPEDRLEREAPSAETPPRAGSQPAGKREIARAERGQAEPTQRHERPGAVVLADGRHPPQRREPEGEAAEEPRPGGPLGRNKTGDDQQRSDRHRDGSRLAERRKRRRQQRRAQQGRN